MTGYSYSAENNSFKQIILGIFTTTFTAFSITPHKPPPITFTCTIPVIFLCHFKLGVFNAIYNYSSQLGYN